MLFSLFLFAWMEQALKWRRLFVQLRLILHIYTGTPFFNDPRKKARRFQNANEKTSPSEKQCFTCAYMQSGSVSGGGGGESEGVNLKTSIPAEPRMATRLWTSLRGFALTGTRPFFGGGGFDLRRCLGRRFENYGNEASPGVKRRCFGCGFKARFSCLDSKSQGGLWSYRTHTIITSASLFHSLMLREKKDN